MHMKQRFHIYVWCTIQDKWEMWQWHYEQLLLDWQFMKETETFLPLPKLKGFWYSDLPPSITSRSLKFLNCIHLRSLYYWLKHAALKQNLKICKQLESNDLSNLVYKFLSPRFIYISPLYQGLQQHLETYSFVHDKVLLHLNK